MTQIRPTQIQTPGDATKFLDGTGVFSTPPGGSPTIEDEGSSLGTAGTLNFTGAGVTATVTTGVATVNVPGGGSTVSATTQTANYTLALADAATVVEMNSATAVTVTVPPNSSVAFPVGSVVEVCQYGAGQVTVAAGAGVTLRSPASLAKTAAQYTSVTLRKRATDEWMLEGSLV